MNSQLYTAASGLIAEGHRLELITNNLANLSTTAFRPLRSFATVYQSLAPGAPAAARLSNAGVAIAGAYEMPGPGTFVPTDRGLDVALAPDELLAVQTPAGRRYTRAGSLQAAPDGKLTDAQGHPVLAGGGKPLTGLGPSSTITADGRVVDGDAELGRLLVVRYDPAVLRREGDNLLDAGGNDAALETVAEPRLRPGYLESSAAQAVVELVRLVETQRAFEAYHKLVSITMNEVNRRTVNEIAGR